MPELKDLTNDVAKAARDAAYVVVGLGVLGFQKAQVRRNDLAKRLAQPRAGIEERIGEVRDSLTKVAKDVDGTVELVIGRIEATLEPIEERLPAQARDLVKQAHEQAREARQQLRNLLLPAA